MSMKSTLAFAALSLFPILGSAQNKKGADPQAYTGPQNRSLQDETTLVRSSWMFSTGNQGSEAPFFTETFGAGLPAGWTITVGPGLDLDGVWVYRGPLTTPNNTVGSQGAYGGVAALASPTTADGYFIFDSDFLDNAGIQGNFGGGVAASPHTSYLTSGVINCTGKTNIDFSFVQNYRRFGGPGSSQTVPATYVDFSIDGGTTWPYTLTLNSNVPVNQATTNGNLQAHPVGQWLANQANVKFRFRFDGDYYYWMIDDIAMDNTPNFRADFTAAAGAPPRDILFGPAAGSAIMGTLTHPQRRSVEFDCNVVTSGILPLYNGRLAVDILQNGSLLTTLNSTPHNSFIGGSHGDTLRFDTLNTYNTPWTAPGPGAYEFVYRFSADSAASGGLAVTLVSDTNTMYITDSIMSQDFDVFSNSIGTDQLGDDLSAMAVRIDLVDDEQLYGVEIDLSALTVPGGQIEVTVYDSSAWIDFTSGFIPNSYIGYSLKTITQQDSTNGRVEFDLTSPATGLPLNLTSDAYYIVATLFSNAGANLIRIRNDASFEQRAGAKFMYVVAQSRWFTGYSNSRTFNMPHIRAVVCPDSVCTVATPPTVTTNGALSITQVSAQTGGNVTAQGSSAVSQRGVCYATSPSPNLSGLYTTDGNGTGTFTSNLNGLTPNTQYYVRAYAINATDTAYGNQTTFTTLPAGLDENGLSAVQLYPNPADDYVTLDLPGFQGTETISLLDLSGRLVRVETIEGNGQPMKHRVDVSQLANGTYLVELNDGQAMRAWRLNVQ